MNIKLEVVHDLFVHSSDQKAPVFTSDFVQAWRESEDGIGGGLADLYGDIHLLDKIIDLLDAAPSSVDLTFQLVECLRDTAAQITKHTGNISSSFYSLQAAIQEEAGQK